MKAGGSDAGSKQMLLSLPNSAVSRVVAGHIQAKLHWPLISELHLPRSSPGLAGKLEQSFLGPGLDQASGYCPGAWWRNFGMRTGQDR